MRFLLTPGRHDADADGLVDRKDRCPRVAGRRRDGCPALPVKITAQRGDHTIGGEIRGPRGCFVRNLRNGSREIAKLSIFRVRHGRDERVGRVPVKLPGQTWIARVGNRGRYYATYAARQNGGLGHCTRASSRVLHPWHR
jgi:hypothetical protein